MCPSSAETALAGEIAVSARLLVWFSPAFPTGAFGFSHGLEWAVEAGDVEDRAGLAAWLSGVIAHGGGWSDAVLAAAAHRAFENDEALSDLADLAMALQPSAERRLESGVQGDAFLRAVQTGWPQGAATKLRALREEPIALPVAVGVAAAGAGFALESTLAAFLTGLAANLVSAALRLAPIGQSDGLRVLAELEPLIAAAAGRGASSSLADLGGCALRSDIASMRHETQVTRLFRS